MDFSKFKTSDWLMVGGGAGMLIFGLFSWASAGGVSGGNAFDFTFTGAIPWLLLVAGGVISMLLAAGVMNQDDGKPWPIILLAIFGLGALLVLIRLIIGPKVCDSFGGENFCVTLDRGIGLILSTAAAIAGAVGAFLNFQASGGELSDLTDMNKLKESFSGDDSNGGDMPPPPPPPAQ